MTWFSTADFVALLPPLALVVTAAVVLLVDPFLKGRDSKVALTFVALGGLALAALSAASIWAEPRLAVGGALALGPLAMFVSLTVLAAAAIAVLYSDGYASRMGFGVGEYYGLLLLSTCGMLFLVAGNDLVSIFIAFELMSLAIYALVGCNRRDHRSREGAVKYFVLGAFSSAFLLYGMALIYGATGTIYLHGMALAMAPGSSGIALAGLALIIVGFAFKVGAVPFHAWIPDAYEGAPASVTGFMAVAVKAAAFGVFLRLLGATGVLGALGAGGTEPVVSAEAAEKVLWLLAALTMVVGNFMALTQQNLKRLLAYSGIAHSGYVLLGLTAASRNPDAGVGALYYLVAYAAMTIGAFAVVVSLAREDGDVERVDDLAGLGARRPGAALAMTIFVVSLVGIPPTAGFMGKLWIFRAAIEAGFVGLTILAALATAVSIYYYLRIVVVMYMSEPAEEAVPVHASWGGNLAIATAAVLTLLIGLLPTGTLDLATRSLAELVGS